MNMTVQPVLKGAGTTTVLELHMVIASLLK